VSSIVLGVAALVGCGGDKDGSDTGADDTAVETDTDGLAAAAELAEVMAGSHEPVPLELMRTKHIAVTVDSPIGPLHFLVDSGASTTVVSTQTGSALGVSGAPGQPVDVQGLSVGSTGIAWSTAVRCETSSA